MKMPQWLIEAYNLFLIILRLVLLPYIYASVTIWLPTSFYPPLLQFCVSFCSHSQLHATPQLMRSISSCPTEYVKGSVAYITIILLGLHYTTNTIRKTFRPNLNNCVEGKGPSRHTSCSVCWSDMEQEEETTLHPPCQNSFHTECIEQIAKYEQGRKGWIACPICRGAMNQESMVSQKIRKLPSQLLIRQVRLDRLCDRACWVNVVFSGFAMTACYAAATLIGQDAYDHPSSLLLISPILLTLVVLVSAATLTLERFCLFEQVACRIKRPSFIRILVNLTITMALLVMGQNIMVPANLPWDRLFKVGLRSGYDHIPGMITVNWWKWMGDFYERDLGMAAAVLAFAVASACGVLTGVYQ